LLCAFFITLSPEKPQALNNDSLNRLKTLISNKTHRVCILLHTNPDGDSAGSSLGLYGYLKKEGFIEVDVVSPDELPAFLKWMPWTEVVTFANENPELAKQKILDADIIFCLDFNGYNRVNSLETTLSNAPGLKILVDHHPNPSSGFNLIFSEIHISSASELLYKLIAALGDESKIDKPIAECLYSGIITDTGSFSYGCNNPETYQITSKLIALGVDGEAIHNLIYNTNTFSRMRLLGHCLGEKLEIVEPGNAAFISLTQSELSNFDHQKGDTEGFVNYALKIQGIRLAAIFIEKKDHIKISFRSVGNVDVNLFAREFFSGGGHKNASGGKSVESLSDAVLKFKNLANSFISRF